MGKVVDNLNQSVFIQPSLYSSKDLDFRNIASAHCRKDPLRFLCIVTIFHKTKMKLFQSTQNMLALLGMSSNKRQFNGTLLIIILSFVTLISFYVTFLANIAQTFKEYTDNINLTTSTSVINVGFVVLVFKKKAIIELIDSLEELIDTSESVDSKFHFE